VHIIPVVRVLANKTSTRSGGVPAGTRLQSKTDSSTQRKTIMTLGRIIAFAMLTLSTASFTQAQDDDRGAVYTMTNSVENDILVFQRSADGTLSRVGTVRTGGAGTGDNFGSNGALALTEDGRWLFAVNAGSNSISLFERRGNSLRLADTVASGGVTPVSIAVSGSRVYVLNDGAPANVTGFFFDDDRGSLHPIENSTRPLSAASPGAPEIGFDRTGSLLVVTEKATNLIDVFQIGDDGTPTSPNFQNSIGKTPFGFAFDLRNNLLVTEAFGGAPNASATSSYEVDGGGNLETISGSVATHQSAACWIVITRNGRFAYASDTGNGIITGYRIGQHGLLSLLDASGNSASTGGANSKPVDLALTRDSRFLYGINVGTGTLLGWRVQADGQLVFIQTTEAIPVSATGLVAQ
jgi:6-phosphogluconolactonase